MQGTSVDEDGITRQESGEYHKKLTSCCNTDHHLSCFTCKNYKFLLTCPVGGVHGQYTSYVSGLHFDVMNISLVPRLLPFFLHGEEPSLVPRPCAFVACSTKFAQRAWARSSRDACRRTRFYVTPDMAAPCCSIGCTQITTNGVGRT